MNDDKFQKLVVSIDEAIRSAAKWGCDADDVLLDQLELIINVSRKAQLEEK